MSELYEVMNRISSSGSSVAAALQKRGKKRRTAMETINRISFLLYSTIIVCYAGLWVAKIQLMRLIYNKSLFF